MNTRLPKIAQRNQGIEGDRIVIIAILAGMLLPALNKARATARGIQCSSNQKQTITALLSYTNDFEFFPWPADDMGKEQIGSKTWTVYWYFRLVQSGYVKSGYKFESSGFFPQTENNVLFCPETLREQLNDASTSKPPSYYIIAGHKGYDKTLTGVSGLKGNSLAVKPGQIQEPSSKFGFVERGKGSLSYNVAWITPANMPGYSANSASGPVTHWFIGFVHNGKSNVAYADGHVGTIITQQVHSPGWSPMCSNWKKYFSAIPEYTGL